MMKKLKVKVTEPPLWLDANVTYAQVPRWFGHVTRDLKLSVIRPWEGHSPPLPLLVWICGGGWAAMDVHAHLPNLVGLARAGFVVASVEYRLADDAKFPAQLHDVKAALRYLRAHAERFGLDKARVGVFGESAGGYLTALAAATGATREFDVGEHLDQSSAVQAACPFYPVVDLDVRRRPGFPADRAGAMLFEDALLGDSNDLPAELYRRANPLTYLTAEAPPHLILHGTADEVVLPAQSELLHDALRALGVPADLYLVEGTGHATPEFYQPQVLALVQAFFDKTLKPRR